MTNEELSEISDSLKHARESYKDVISQIEKILLRDGLLADDPIFTELPFVNSVANELVYNTWEVVCLYHMNSIKNPDKNAEKPV